MDFENWNVKINSEDQALLLPCLLPLSYKHFGETVIYDKEDKSMDDVKSSIFSKDLIDRELTNVVANDGKAKVLNVRGKNIK